MRCDQARERWSELRPGEAPAGDLAAHLEACADCASALAFQASLEAGFRRAVSELAPARLGGPVRTSRRPWKAWAAAAALLLAAGGFWMRREPATPASPSRSDPGTPGPLQASGGRLELGEGASAALSGDGGTLTLSRGLCWLETGGRPVRLEGPFPVTVSANAALELEVRRGGEGLAALLLGQALAGEGPVLSVGVFAGSVEGAGLRLTAGQKACLGAADPPEPRPLEEGDRARIEGWRAARLEARASGRVQAALRLEPGSSRLLEDPGEPRVLAAGIRARGAHLRLRTPLPHGGVAEVSLGNLPALRDGAWHRLAVRADGRWIEAFLDGRSLLRAPALPAESGFPGFSLEALGGPVDLRDLRTGRDAP